MPIWDCSSSQANQGPFRSAASRSFEKNCPQYPHDKSHTPEDDDHPRVLVFPCHLDESTLDISPLAGPESAPFFEGRMLEGLRGPI